MFVLVVFPDSECQPERAVETTFPRGWLFAQPYRGTLLLLLLFLFAFFV